MNGGKKVYLPDGRIITIPDNLSDEHKNLLVRGILNEFPELRDLGRFLEEEEGLGRPPQGQKYDRAAIDIRRSLYGLPGVPVPGSATDPLKNLPVTEAHEVERGATGTSSSPEDQQNIAQSIRGMGPAFSRGLESTLIALQQGVASIGTADKETEWEKELIRKRKLLYEDIDPNYKETWPDLISTGLGSAAGFGLMSAPIAAAAIAAIPAAPAIVLSLGVAGGIGSLMLRGERSQAISDFEARTGIDVSKEDELKALRLSALLGASEAAPIARAFKYAKPFLRGKVGEEARRKIIEQGSRHAASKYAQSMALQGLEEGIQEGSQSYLDSWIGQAIYDDEAMVGAELAALKDAIVGGQVGAIYDVLVRLGTNSLRKRGGRLRSHWETRAAEKILESWDEAVEGEFLNDPNMKRIIESDKPEDAQTRQDIVSGVIYAAGMEEIDARIREIKENDNLDQKEKSERIHEEEKGAKRFVSMWLKQRLAIKKLSEQTLATQQRADEPSPAKINFTNLISRITRSAETYDPLKAKRKGIPLSQHRNPITLEDAATIGNPNAAGVPSFDTYSISGVIDRIRRVLKSSQITNEDASRLANSEEDISDLSSRLVRPAQRDALEDLIKRFEAGDTEMSPSELRETLDKIFNGGIYTANQASVEFRSNPNGTESVYIENPSKNTATNKQKALSQQIKNIVLDSAIGFESLSGIGIHIENTRSDKVSPPGQRELSPFVTDLDTHKIVQDLIKNNLNITQKFAQDAFKTRRIGQSFKSFVADTLNMNVRNLTARYWTKLSEGQKQAVMSRILRSDIQAVEGARHFNVSRVIPRAGKYILGQLARKTSKGAYPQLYLGTPNKRAKAVQDLTKRVNRALRLTGTKNELFVEDVVNYLERAADYGVLKYLSPTKTGDYTRVQFRTVKDALNNIPQISFRAQDIARIKANIAKKGTPRSERQLQKDAETLKNLSDRIERFKEVVERILKNLGMEDQVYGIQVAADSLYATSEEIIKDPKIVLDSRMEAEGPTASLQNHGNMLLFNLSQMEALLPDGINTPIEAIIGHASLHEGTHKYFINQELYTSEVRDLYRAIKTVLVPETVSMEAHKKGQTFHEWQKEESPRESDEYVSQEAAVRLLDAVMQNHISATKTKGILADIKKRLTARAKALIGATRDSDLLSVMRVVEKIQTGEMKERRRKRMAEGKGMATLQLFDFATPEQKEQMRKAYKEGGKEREEALKKVTDEFVKSQIGFEEIGVDPISTQQALINEWRARREIDDTPNFMLPVLNRHSLENGLITPDMLATYYDFKDGTLPPFRVASEVREKRSTFVPNPEMAKIAEEGDESGRYKDPDSPEAVRVVQAFSEWQMLPNGEWVTRASDLQKILESGVRDDLRRNIADDRLSLQKLHMTAAEHELETVGPEYSRRLQAEYSAIEAIRMYDIASRFSVGTFKFGPPTMRNGFFEFIRTDENGDPLIGLDDKGEPTGGDLYVFAPLWDSDFGKYGEKIFTNYTAAQRILQVFERREAAKQRLKDAQAAGANPEVIAELRVKVRDLMDAYNVTNPLRGATGVRWFPIETIFEKDENGNVVKDSETGLDKTFMKGVKDTIADIEAQSNAGDALAGAVVEAARRLRKTNPYWVDYAAEMGLISLEQRDFLRDLDWTPFYRDKEARGIGRRAHFLENSDNSNVKMRRRENVVRIRRGSIIDEKLKGSLEPIRENVSANILANHTSILADGLWNDAVVKFIESAMSIGGMVEVPTVPAELEKELGILDRVLKEKNLSKEERSIHKKRRKVINAEINKINKRKTKVNDALNEKGYDTIEIVVHGVYQPLIKKDIPAIMERLQQEENARARSEGREAREIQPEEAFLAKNLKVSEFAVQEQKMINHGEVKIYRAFDSYLAQSLMTLGFDPIQALEDHFDASPFLSKHPIANWGVRNMAKLYWKAPTALREGVVRAPPFALKNVWRDSWGAGQKYGHTPTIMFNSFRNLLLKGDTVRRAEEYGLNMPAYWLGSRSPTRQRQQWEQMMKVERRKREDLHLLSNPWKHILKMWDFLGAFTNKAEVAVRVAIVDQRLKDGRSTKEAISDARELVNYGRSGSSPLLRILTASTSFMNGRIVGVDSFYQTARGGSDSPTWTGAKAVEAAARGYTPRSRSALLALRATRIILAGNMITFMYWLMVHDEEWYKEAPDHIKYDNWLYPLPGGSYGKLSTPFELGLFLKVFPELILETLFNDEVNWGDMREEVIRQLNGSLGIIEAPQIFKPMIDVMMNRNSLTKEKIVPTFMDETIVKPMQHNEFTGEWSQAIAESIASIPLLEGMPGMTSPQKLEYMSRLYFGTIGTYVLAVLDRITREIRDENIVGTKSDFPFVFRRGEGIGWPGEGWLPPINPETLTNLPMFGDMFYNPLRTSNRLDELRAIVDEMDTIIASIGRIRKDEHGFEERREKEEKHRDILKHRDRLQKLNDLMRRYYETMQFTLSRKDKSDEWKREEYKRLLINQNRRLAEHADLLKEIKMDENIIKQLTGYNPW